MKKNPTALLSHIDCKLSFNVCCRYTILGDLVKMKKPPTTLLAHQNYHPQWKWMLYLVVSLALLNPGSVLRADPTEAVASINNDNDTVKQEEGIDASFEKASHPTAPSQTYWTMTGEAQAVFTVLTGIAAACSFAYFNEEGPHREQGHREEGASSKRLDERSVNLKRISRKVNDPEIPEKAMQQKLINGMIPLIKNIEEVNSFLGEEPIDENNKLNLLLYFYSSHNVPGDCLSRLATNERQRLFEAAESYRKANFQDEEAIGLWLVEEQYLDEMKKTFSAEASQNYQEMSKSYSWWSSSKEKQLLQEQKNFHNTSVVKGVIQSSEITTSQKLDLLNKLFLPFTPQKDRLAIIRFNHRSAEINDLLKTSKEDRISIVQLLEELPEEQRQAALFNIGLDPDLTYDQKVDLLVVASNQKNDPEAQLSIIKGENLQKEALKNKHASNCTTRFFESFLKDADKDAITGHARGVLRETFINNSQNLSYSERWNLICHYLQSEEEVRLSILNFSASNRNQKLLNSSKNATQTWVDRFRNENIQKDIGSIVGVQKPRSGSDDLGASTVATPVLISTISVPRKSPEIATATSSLSDDGTISVYDRVNYEPWD